jgi:hypothetical protein
MGEIGDISPKAGAAERLDVVSHRNEELRITARSPPSTHRYADQHETPAPPESQLTPTTSHGDQVQAEQTVHYPLHSCARRHRPRHPSILLQLRHR